MIEPATVLPPDGGLWHVGRSASLFDFRRPQPVDTREARAGNRFDSFHGNYGVVYFAHSPEACFAEVLARFRPEPGLAELVADEWDQRGFMMPGNMPADWRMQRTLARARVVDPLPFIDTANPDTLEAFRQSWRITSWLRAFGLDPDVDLGTLVSSDRRVTRLISQWIFDAEDEDEDGNALYGGVRYISRMGDGYECWGVFEGSEIELAERKPIDLNRADLQLVAKRYGLTLH